MAANTLSLALKIVKTNAQLALQLETWNRENQQIAFVPTMGSLHAGHLHLLAVARSYAPKVVCSIFVNPTQFNDKADFDRYPRNLETDIQKLETTQCDLLFAPDPTEVYDNSPEITHKMNFGSLEAVMEGAHRPGHFNGVGTVVKRLFELVKPHFALFGLKDYQQFSIIKNMVKQYNMPVKLIGVDTVREPSGLAMSSRNALLDELHLELAPVIYSALTEAKQNVDKLPVNSLKFLVEQRLLQLPDVKIDYIEIADAETLEPLQSIDNTKKARIFVAAYFGKIRLIDNIALN